jgi:hypothetical protein
VQANRIEGDRGSARFLAWDAEELKHVREAARGVGAAAEPKQVDPVSRLPDADDRGVTFHDPVT